MAEYRITINPDGSCEWLWSRELAPLEDALGPAARMRVSHIEPVNVLLRVLFHVFRASQSEAVAVWTRGWRCWWRVNIINGPTWGRYRDRLAAIDAEHLWLSERKYLR